MSMEEVKTLMQEVGWGMFATSDGEKVGVRPIGSCKWFENELWCATMNSSDKAAQLRKVPFGEYCFATPEGKHVRIAGPCSISTNNDDKLKLYEAVPLLKNYIQDPSDPEYVVIRMKPERIRLMKSAELDYEQVLF